MKMRRSLLLLTGIFFTAVIATIFAGGVQGVEEVTSDSPLMRADVITIDAVKSFGDLEQPPVVFLHDLHTDALEKQNKDCSACHLSEENRQSPKFMQLQDTSRQEVMDIYHELPAVSQRGAKGWRKEWAGGGLRSVPSGPAQGCL